MARYAVRASAYGSMDRDILRVIESEFIEPWKVLEQFVEDVEHEFAGWDRYARIDIQLERVS